MNDSNSPDYLLLYCTLTLRCNYRCPYCYLNAYDGRLDWFNDHSPEEWMEALLRSFPNRRLQFELQGGEPLIYKPALEFLRILVDSDNVDYIRVNTNGTTVDKLARDLPSPKIRLMCTYHPSQVALDEFLGRLVVAQKAGIVEMAKVVVVPEEFDRVKIEDMVRLFADEGVFLDVAYDWTRARDYRSEDLRFLFSLRTKRDAEFAMKCETLGQRCAAGVNYAEIINTGDVLRCQDRGLLGNVFKTVHLLEKPAPCPLIYCCCINRYSHMLSWRCGDHHLANFVARNKKHREGLPETNWTTELSDVAFQRLVDPPRSVAARKRGLEMRAEHFAKRVRNKVAKIKRQIASKQR